jgi:hypothetical protein
MSGLSAAAALAGVKRRRSQSAHFSPTEYAGDFRGAARQRAAHGGGSALALDATHAAEAAGAAAAAGPAANLWPSPNGGGGGPVLSAPKRARQDTRDHSGRRRTGFKLCVCGCGRGGVKRLAALAEYGDAGSRIRQQIRVLGLSFERREQIVTGEGEGVQHLIAKEDFSTVELLDARNSVPDLRFVSVEGAGAYEPVPDAVTPARVPKRLQRAAKRLANSAAALPPLSARDWRALATSPGGIAEDDAALAQAAADAVGAEACERHRALHDHAHCATVLAAQDSRAPHLNQLVVEQDTDKSMPMVQPLSSCRRSTPSQTPGLLPAVVGRRACYHSRRRALIRVPHAPVQALVLFAAVRLACATRALRANRGRAAGEGAAARGGAGGAAASRR